MRHREVDGVSSNGRTAVSGAVCGGSTPPTPAIFRQRETYVAPSSSGLGRRPLKAEVAGSNPVGATKSPRHPLGGVFGFGRSSAPGEDRRIALSEYGVYRTKSVYGFGR